LNAEVRIQMDRVTVAGIGVGVTRDCSTLMVAQYFKRRREFVEIFIVSGSGLGIAVMSAFIKGAIRCV
jgi:predicted RND superfamily exporter protein